MSHQRRDFEVEQTIFLGGQISEKHKSLQDIARLSPDYAIVYMILKSIPDWEKTEDPLELVVKIIELFGEVDFMAGCSELTKLSAILGDYRKRYSMKKEVQEIASPPIADNSQP